VPRRLNFIQWRTIFVGPHYVACSSYPSGAYSFEMAPRFWKMCALRLFSLCFNSDRLLPVTEATFVTVSLSKKLNKA